MDLYDKLADLYSMTVDTSTGEIIDKYPSVTVIGIKCDYRFKTLNINTLEQDGTNNKINIDIPSINTQIKVNDKIKITAYGQAIGEFIVKATTPYKNIMCNSNGYYLECERI